MKLLATFLVDFTGILSCLVLLVHRLQEKGIKTVLLSGDREGAVATVAKNVGIESDSTNYSLSPELKFKFISNLQSSGHRVAMVRSSTELQGCFFTAFSCENLMKFPPLCSWLCQS